MTCPIAGIHFHLHPSDIQGEASTGAMLHFYGIPVYADGETPHWLELHQVGETPILRMIEP